MVAANDDTRSAITNGWVTGISADGNVETSPAITKDGSVNILFDDLTFTHEEPIPLTLPRRRMHPVARGHTMAILTPSALLYLTKTDNW